MSEDNIRQLPQHVTLDLDAYERPVDEVKPTFTANVGDRVVTMIDPANVDWRDLLVMEDPNEFLRHAFSPEDRKHLLAQPLPGWKFNKLMDAYYNHYELEEQIRKARQQQRLAGI